MLTGVACLAIVCVAIVAVLAGEMGEPGGDSVRLANSRLALTFDRQTGALLSLMNLQTGDEYLKDPKLPGNPFVLHVDPTVIPQAARDPGWWSAEVEEDLGGLMVSPGGCRVISLKQQSSRSAATVTIESEHAKTGLRQTLTITLPTQAEYADLTLRVTNTGSLQRTVVTAFPHLRGLSLGPDRETNLGIMMASYGTPGVRAWANSGGWYGRETSMQWQAAYEPRLDEGIGMIIMDPECASKLIRRGPGGLLSTLHYPGTILAPGASHVYPTARLVVHRGTWRVTAQRYSDWYARAFRVRKPPSWLKDVDLYYGGWIPSADQVARAKRESPSDGFTSFERMPLLYRDGPYDLIEWAMYNQGVVDEPESYGPYMGDGLYLFRSDLGGPAAMREGVRRLHAMGRRIMFYVAGNSLLRSSALLKGQRPEDWMLMDRPGHGYDVGYPNGFSVCPGYGPWQQHLAHTARRILAESGADGIRLDELAGFVPCFNPAHRHRSPYDSVRWLRELTRTVRAAMDEVNPDAILLTENPLDAVHESVNGALQMFQSGREIDAMRIAVPTMVGMAYHPGAVESALNGWIGGKVTARRVTWPWEHRGLAGKPDWYADGPGPELRWHELRASFPEAIGEGRVATTDPSAPSDPRWVGRLWKARRYWLLVGGTLDATPLQGELRVIVPGLPARIRRAVEIDAQTLRPRDADLRRSGGMATIVVRSAVSAVIFPMPDCPPLMDISGELRARRGGEITLDMKPIPLGGRLPSRVRIACPGLIDGSLTARWPGSVRLVVPPAAMVGLYPLRGEGDCLPVKRWIRVADDR